MSIFEAHDNRKKEISEEYIQEMRDGLHGLEMLWRDEFPVTFNLLKEEIDNLSKSISNHKTGVP